MEKIIVGNNSRGRASVDNYLFSAGGTGIKLDTMKDIPRTQYILF